MKSIKYFVVTGIFAATLGLSACANSVDPSEAYRNESQEQIFQRAEAALRDHNFQEAIKRLEAYDVQYPFGPHSETAQLHVIYAYYKNSDYASAEAAADRFIRVHPTSPHVDYALFMRGVSNYYQNQGFFERVFSVDFATRDLTQVKKSFNDFAQVVQRYPNSYYAPAAHQYMIYLRDVLARHQVEIARYYYNHHAYVASADRAAMVVEHYPGSPRVPEALIIMAKSYHNLHQTALENETLNVIQYNYPNSAYLQQVNESSLPNANRIAPPSTMYVAPSVTHRHISHSYAFENANPDAKPRNAFSENTPYAQNGERNRGRGVTLGQLVNRFGGTTKNFWSMGPSKTNHAQQVNINPVARKPTELAKNTPSLENISHDSGKVADRATSQDAVKVSERTKSQDKLNRNIERDQALQHAMQSQTAPAVVTHDQAKLQDKPFPYMQNGDRR